MIIKRIYSNDGNYQVYKRCAKCIAVNFAISFVVKKEKKPSTKPKDNMH